MRTQCWSGHPKVSTCVKFSNKMVPRLAVERLVDPEKTGIAMGERPPACRRPPTRPQEFGCTGLRLWWDWITGVVAAE